MNYQVFLDESGGKGHSETFVFAGLIATQESWSRFGNEWRRSLQTSPPLTYFKMREAASLGGQFRGFSPEERDRKLRELARIVCRHATAAFHCTLNLDAFEDTIAPLGRPFSDPYFWPFHVSLMALAFDLVERGQGRPARIVFDEHSIFGPRAASWYPVVRAMLTDPAEAAVMPQAPCFGSDDEFLPLQAADMLAWLFRRSMQGKLYSIESFLLTGTPPCCEGDGREQQDYAWLVSEEFSHLEMSPHSQFLTADRLRRIVGLMAHHLATSLRDVEVPAEAVAEMRKVLGNVDEAG